MNKTYLYLLKVVLVFGVLVTNQRGWARDLGSSLADPAALKRAESLVKSPDVSGAVKEFLRSAVSTSKVFERQHRNHESLQKTDEIKIFCERMAGQRTEERIKLIYNVGVTRESYDHRINRMTSGDLTTFLATTTNQTFRSMAMGAQESIPAVRLACARNDMKGLSEVLTGYFSMLADVNKQQERQTIGGDGADQIAADSCGDTCNSNL